MNHESPVQRLLIVHLNLAKLCTGNDLGETASLEEWQEQILFYYNSQQSAGLAAAAAATQQDAIQFAGLCAALNHLPNTLSYNQRSKTTHEKYPSGRDDPTQEVHFGQSTLVFVPLQERENMRREQDNKSTGATDTARPVVLSVVQLPRSSASGIGGNAWAIQAFIERWYKLFCLLRGGGIDEQLRRAVCTNIVGNENNNLYPGMLQLFKGLKTLRHLEESMDRSLHPDSDLKLEHDKLKEELAMLRRALPITFLREDLAAHFHFFVGDLSSVCGKQGCGGTSLASSISPSLLQFDESHASELAPEVVFHLNKAIESVLSGNAIKHETCSEESNYPELRFISIFYRGTAISHHNCKGTSNDAKTSASLLMWYLASYSCKVKQQQKSQQNFASETQPQRISQGLVSLSDHALVATDGDTILNGPKWLLHYLGPQQLRGEFLETPPLAMLSISDQKTTQVTGPNGQFVWAPLIHYTTFCGGNVTLAEEESEFVHAILYQSSEELSFLILLSPTKFGQSQDNLSLSWPHNRYNGDDDETASLLRFIENSLMDALDVVGSHINSPQPAIKFFPGRDIIYLDQNRPQSVFVQRCRTITTHDTGGSSMRPKRLMHRFFWRKTSSNSQKKQFAFLDHNAVVSAARGLDYRNQLASQLSVGTIIPEDVTNEVAFCQTQWRNAVREYNNGKSSAKYESLMTVSGGWIYAFANCQDRELYIILDGKEYVTIADAEKGISEVCAVLLFDAFSQ